MKSPLATPNTNELSWQQNLWAMWFAEFVAIVGFAVVIPMLPLYVRSLGVEGERQVAMWSGAVFSAQAATMAIFGPIWGALSDRYGRKIMVERAMVAGALIMGLMALAQSPLQLVILRAVQGAFTGTVTAATALVATSAPKDRAGYALGTLQMAIFLGATAGPLLGGVIADAFGYRSAFVVTGVLLLLAAAGVLVFVKEPHRPVGDRAAASGDGGEDEVNLRARVLKQFSPVLESAPILALLGVGLVMQSAARVIGPTLPLFVEAIVPRGAHVATISGVVTGARALGAALGGRGLGELGDRLGYRTILVGSAMASVVFYAPQSLVDRWVWLMPLQLGAGLAMGGILASIGASLAALAPSGREGIVYGVDTTVVSVAKAIAPAMGSLVAAWWGLRAPFLAAAVAFALGGVVALRLLPEPQHAGSTNSERQCHEGERLVRACCEASSGCDDCSEPTSRPQPQ